jgi:hypothetical protein
MKIWALTFGVVGVGGALLPAPEPAWTLAIGGDADGYLSPCGCTAPMTGGVRRRATAIRKLEPHTHVVVIDTGGLGGAPGRQGELKAETAAQIAASIDAAAVHLTERDAALGPGSVASITRLAEGRVVSTSVPEGAVENVRPFNERGPFLIGGASALPEVLSRALGVAARTPAEAATSLVQAARARRKSPVLMFSGSHEAAADLARTVPGLGVIVYRASGDPPRLAERVGQTLLITPGERGKHVVRLSYDGKAYGGYVPIKLGPEFADDKDANRLYRTYLSRVDRANLLDRVPRLPSDPFAGTEACGKCHGKALEVWHGTKHTKALTTLEHDGHGRDPDCVGCHVVGLGHQGGFTSREATPDLAAVGCESCHGPGANHAKSPMKFQMPKIGEAACASCHTAEQSPNFNFLTYWRKIAH